MRHETKEIFGWLEKWDYLTSRHMRRTAITALMIGEALYENNQYPKLITEKYLKDLGEAALLHDCGKIAVPQGLLRKEGKLLEDEYELIKRHTIYGRIFLEGILARNRDESYYPLAVNGACFHHEAYDGSGYPCGLSGEEIPLSARIIAVADVFDALSFTRSYKKQIPFPEALSIIRAQKGTKFDPAVVDAFYKCQEQIHSFVGKCYSY